VGGYLDFITDGAVRLCIPQFAGCESAFDGSKIYIWKTYQDRNEVKVIE
jgi:hypothetical protein